MFGYKKTMNQKEIFEYFKKISEANSSAITFQEFNDRSIILGMNVNHSKHHIVISIFDNKDFQIIEFAILISSHIPSRSMEGYNFLYQLLERNNELLHMRYVLRFNTVTLMIRCTTDEITKQFLGEVILLLTSESNYAKSLLGFQ